MNNIFIVSSTTLKLQIFILKIGYMTDCQLGKDKLGCDSHMIESPYLNVPVKILPSKLFSVLCARFDRWEE